MKRFYRFDFCHSLKTSLCFSSRETVPGGRGAGPAGNVLSIIKST